MTARPTARLIPSSGLPTLEGVTVCMTACCDMSATHAVDVSGDDDKFDLTAWWSERGEQITACKCGNPLPDAKAWRP